VKNIITIEEVEALRSVHEMIELYGWRVPMIWTPALVKHMFNEQFGRPMTDQEWDIFAAGECWNGALVMAGAISENKVIIDGMKDAVEDAENAAAVGEMNRIYFLDSETNTQEAFERIADDFFGDMDA